MFRKALFVVLLSLADLCIGQTPSPPLYFDQLTIADGLSHNTVFCLLQDHNGYIWIGTQNGLNKYDGYTFEVFRSTELGNNNTGFKGKHISCIFEDKLGNLWVGTQKYGINFKAKSSDQFVNLQSNPSFDLINGYDISSIFEDNDGNVWIASVGAGVLKYNPNTKLSQCFNNENNNLSNNLAFDVVQDKYGVIWVATAGGGINYLINDNDFTLSHEMLPNHPNMGGYRKKLFLDDEYLWLGTEGTGLYQMNLKDRSYLHFSPWTNNRTISSNVIRDVYKTKDGKLFIATDGSGLNVYNPANQAISTYQYHLEDQAALNSNALLCLLGDRTGNIWIGTYNGGINIYKPNKTWFDIYKPSLSPNNELQHQSILSILESNNGKIFVGTDGGGLNWLNQNHDNFEISSFIHDPTDPNSIAGNVVKTLFEDSQNRLWLGVFREGLDLFNYKTKTFKHIIDWNSSIWSIAERKDSNLLIATMGNGISLVNSKTFQVSKFQPKTNKPNNLQEQNIMIVFVDKSGRVWIGSAENGLDILDKNDQHLWYCKFEAQDSFSISNDAIRTIYQDSDDSIWIGTERGGINKWLGNGKFERITKKDGLIANSVMGISEDKEGFLWISTFEGISRYNRRKKTFRNFDFRTSQNTNQFNQDAIVTDANGKLFFGGIYGLNAIHPKRVIQNHEQPEIIFTDLKIYNKSIPVGKLPNGRVILKAPIENSSQVWLNYLDESFSIDFTAIDFTDPKENEFAYKMEGFNEDWQYTSAGQSSVTYTNLDPGTYTFMVKHKDKMASLMVSIKPPYWQTMWFRVLAFFLTLGIIFSGLFFWIKRREAAANRKILQLKNEKLATEIEAKNSKLMFSSVQMAHKNEVLTEVKKDLIEFEKKPESNFRSLIRKLDHELKNEDYWKEFYIYFNEVDQKFLDRIIKRHPNLTKNDLRMCSLLKMNLSTKEIASILNISVRAIEQSRYRLKKRLSLENHEDLDKYISSFRHDN